LYDLSQSISGDVMRICPFSGSSALFDELKSKVLQPLRLNKSFKADSVSEPEETPEYLQFRDTFKEIKKIFEQMTSTAFGGKYVPMRTGDAITYEKVGLI